MIIRRTEDLAIAARQARRQLKLSQIDLANRLAVDRHWVRRFEAGEPGVSFGLVLRVLNELGLSIKLDTATPGTKRIKPTISIDDIVDE